jgi:hypothetical protein
MSGEIPDAGAVQADGVQDGGVQADGVDADVVDQATARRRELIAGILAPMPRTRQREVAAALGLFADAAGEIPDSDWAAVPFDEPGRGPSAGCDQATPRRAPPADLALGRRTS